MLQCNLHNRNLNTDNAPRSTTLNIREKAFINKSKASHILITKRSLSIALPLTPLNIHLKENSHTSFTLQLPLPLSITKFVLRVMPKNKPNSTFMMSANSLQKTDDKFCEQSEQISITDTIFDNKSRDYN